MKVTFLGTAAGQPSLNRNCTSIAIEIDNSEYILVDCGEATLHQIMRSSLKLSKINCIVITHLHGDHIFGLPGLICTMNDVRETPLYIYGPRGLKDFCKTFEKSVHSFTLKVHEYFNPYNDICDLQIGNFNVHIESCRVRHTTECYAYAISKSRVKNKINISALNPIISTYKHEIEEIGYNPAKKIIGSFSNDDSFKIEFKSKETGELIKLYSKDYIIPEPSFKIVIALDNNNCENIFTYFKSCNVLIHESTYAIVTADANDEITRKAISYGHSTSLMATNNAARIHAETLILTHFSNRYDISDGKMVIEDKMIETCLNTGYTGNIKAAYDFSVFEFKY